jgi:hypothetical protein
MHGMSTLNLANLCDGENSMIYAQLNGASVTDQCSVNHVPRQSSRNEPSPSAISQSASPSWLSFVIPIMLAFIFCAVMLIGVDITLLLIDHDNYADRMKARAGIQ